MLKRCILSSWVDFGVFDDEIRCWKENLKPERIAMMGREEGEELGPPLNTSNGPSISFSFSVVNESVLK